eukprot:EG_transcript_6174
MAFVPPTTLLDVPSPRFGGRLAVIIPAAVAGQQAAVEVSYTQLDQQVSTVAAHLRALLPAPVSGTVAIAIENRVEFVLAFLGAPRAGAATAPLNPAYLKDEFRFYLEDNDARVLLVGPEGNPAAQLAAQELGLPIYQLTLKPEGLAVDWVSGPGPNPLLPSPDAPPAWDAAAVAETEALFMHTSGTTSRPKRVPLLHRNMAASIHNIQRTYELGPEDRTLLVMPLFHIHGLMAVLLATLASGGAVILHGKFSASRFWADATAHAATWYSAVPTMHQVLLMRADKDYPKASPPPLRFIRSCSSSLAPAVLEGLEAQFGVSVLEAYAMTENAHQMTSNPLPKAGPRKPGSVGKPTFVELAILDPDCNVLPAEEIGEVCIKGPSVTPGYTNNPAANEEAFKGGWFHTGDQGKLDAEGYLTLTGRIKELINRGGEKISPLEIDAILLAHPSVGEAVSFAAADPKYGEVVHAVVTAKPGLTLTPQDVQEHCGRHLAAFKIPSKVYVADTVPRTATGKIQRRIVAEHFAKAGAQ